MRPCDVALTFDVMVLGVLAVGADDVKASPSVSQLAAQLERLRTRQELVLQALQRRNLIDAEATLKAETSFAQLPEYIEKLHKVQADMDGLAARTASMRVRAASMAASSERTATGGDQE